MAVRAVTAIGLDVAAWISCVPISRRATRPWAGNLRSQCGARLSHARGAERRHAGTRPAVIDMLFPPGAPSRVPIACITGTNGKTTTARMLAHIAKMAGFTPGLTTTDGVYIDGQRTVEGDMTGRWRHAWCSPTRASTRRARSRPGWTRSRRMGCRLRMWRRAQCAIRPFGMKGVDTLEQLAEVKRIVVEVARDCAVLNADDEHTIGCRPTPTRSICAT